jgi:uncharacterized protein (TIGR02118 family)
MIVSVIYPKTETSTFDHSYYHETHLPLVGRLWGAHDLRGVTILRGTEGLGGAPAYELIALLEFPDREAFLKAAAAHGDEVMGDIANFSNVQPVVQFNDQVVG